MIQVVRDKEYWYEIFLVEGDLGQIYQDSSHSCKCILHPSHSLMCNKIQIRDIVQHRMSPSPGFTIRFLFSCEISRAYMESAGDWVVTCRITDVVSTVYCTSSVEWISTYRPIYKKPRWYFSYLFLKELDYRVKFISSKHPCLPPLYRHRQRDLNHSCWRETSYVWKVKVLQFTSKVSCICLMVPFAFWQLTTLLPLSFCGYLKRFSANVFCHHCLADKKKKNIWGCGWAWKT